MQMTRNTILKIDLEAVGVRNLDKNVLSECYNLNKLQEKSEYVIWFETSDLKYEYEKSINY